MAASGLYGALEDCFGRHAEQPVLEIESRQRATYRELDAEVARCANALRDFGLRRGDRVVSQVEKSPQALVLYLACLRSGCASRRSMPAAGVRWRRRSGSLQASS